MDGFNPWVGKIHWRREWQPTPIFLPGEFHEPGMEAGVGVGERVGRMQSNMETHTPLYVEQPAGGGLLHDSGNSHWGSATAT